MVDAITGCGSVIGADRTRLLVSLAMVGVRVWHVRGTCSTVILAGIGRIWYHSYSMASGAGLVAYVRRSMTRTAPGAGPRVTLLSSSYVLYICGVKGNVRDIVEKPVSAASADTGCDENDNSNESNKSAQSKNCARQRLVFKKAFGDVGCGSRACRGGG